MSAVRRCTAFGVIGKRCKEKICLALRVTHTLQVYSRRAGRQARACFERASALRKICGWVVVPTGSHTSLIRQGRSIRGCRSPPAHLGVRLALRLAEGPRSSRLFRALLNFHAYQNHCSVLAVPKNLCLERRALLRQTVSNATAQTRQQVLYCVRIALRTGIKFMVCCRAPTTSTGQVPRVPTTLAPRQSS